MNAPHQFSVRFAYHCGDKLTMSTFQSAQHVVKISHEYAPTELAPMEIYRFGGLHIASDFPLPELKLCYGEVEARCEVVVRCASIPEEVASATAKFIFGG